MAFFIGFNYNILRNMKEASLVTAEASGAEVIPFLKVWGIVPIAFLMTFVYSKLNNHLQRDKVFLSMIGLFLAFFVVFTFVLFPLRDTLHLHRTAHFLESVLPAGCKGFIAMVRYWIFSSFYIMSDLWSSTILSMLFWGFANEVTRLEEAKRFYGLIALGLNVAAITSGQASVFLTSSFIHKHLPLKSEAWENSLVLLTIVVVLCGLLIMGIHRWMVRNVVSPKEALHKEPETPKIRMSMRENFAYLARSKYLVYLALIVLSYNIIINLVEVIWKDQVKQLYPDPNAFAAYMSQITTVTGTISFFTSFLISGQLIRRCGWTFSACITPIILLVTSIGFFFFFFGSNIFLGMLAALGTSPLALVVFFGSAQNCLCRAAKFTLFDGTKEMAFIPLSMESKLKGKAAIDGVGSRLGKSGGSLIHQSLLMIFSTISASAAYVAGILLVVIIVWLLAIRGLGKQFQAVSTVHTALSDPLPPEKQPALTPT
jgi:AAA family ATP:ADP antiporter